MMRWTLSWICYWLGDAVSRVMNLSDWLGGTLYPIYNRLMIWSNRLQGDGPGPWEGV